MQEQKFRVDFNGILNILSKHLYSSEEVFLRELLQNSIDAITLRKQNIEIPIQGIINVELVNYDDKKIIIFEDNGIGLTIDEVDKFLSVIGSSSKKDILNREDANNSFIGQFGIGLLSCFMVSEKITLITKSEKSEKAVKWVASIDGTYVATEIEAQDINTGTKIFLELDKSKNREYTPEKLEHLLKKYSQFLDIEVNFATEEFQKRIQQNSFPWDREQPATDKEIIEFGRNYFKIDFNHFIPLRSDDGKSKGIGFIYPFPADIASKQSNHVYIKNMLIDESSGDVLPDWAFFIKAVISSEVLKPTASRESIYLDENLKATKAGFEHSIRDYFKEIASTAPSILEEIIGIHSLAVKSFASKDSEFFNLIFEHLKFPTSIGSLKAKDFRNYNDINFVEDLDTFRQLLPIAKANKQLLINGGYIYDTTLLTKIAQKTGYDLNKLDNYRYEDIFNEVSWEEDNELSTFLENATDVLAALNCVPVLKRYKPTNLPSIFHSNDTNKITREIDRTKESTTELWSGMLDEFAQGLSSNNHSNLYLNIDNKLIQKIITIDNFDLFTKSLELIYLNSLMAGHFTLNDLESEKMNTNLLAIINQAIEQ